MVIPNIGAFMAWGLITTLFIPTGWLAKTNLDWDWEAITGNIVGPTIVYLLPVLVAYTGGKLIHGHRGGVLGAVAVLGVIGGASFELASGASAQNVPQFLGAMIVGPLAGYAMREVDKWLEDKRPAGFEMLINNFSQAISGLLLALLGYVVIGPITSSIANAFGNMVEGLSDAGLLPLMDLPIEVGKVLFLNNAINHGVLTPLGTTDVAETGYSIYYMLESNPGPGLGLLLAYWFAGKGLAKLSAPGSIIIHFFGGIHEVYFPYVLMNPVMIGAMWAGGIVADIVFVIFDAGLTGPPSPGSIFAYFSFLPSDGGAVAGVLLGIAAGAAAAFIVGSILLRLFPVPEIDDSDDDTSLDDAMEGVPLN
ncbi:MAG: PTS transporter subunit EIIC [Acidimicrobiaceae bacterium]|nr:PTS transporter subunit EIIC [Acidimicrobiaceae bacterium]MDE0318916.1 PTS transporter subunit EIIC [Acidimicrobiaceae bacterium]